MASEEHELHRLRSAYASRNSMNAPSEDSNDEGQPGPGQSSMPSDVGDPDLERRTLRKLDCILLPFLALLFLFNSLDKSNIGVLSFSLGRASITPSDANYRTRQRGDGKLHD